jgi:UDP-GlcNAc:undecaprenyl-phosphate GlcNAc-1-phosphate transferase
VTLFGHPTAQTVAVRHGATAAAAGVLAAGAARLAYAALRRRPPGGEKTWTRTNHRGEPVTLTEGPAVTAGALAALALVSALPKQQAFAERIVPTRPATIPLVIAGMGAAAFGVYDDLTGSGKRRGLRGHLGALLHGEVTTGAVKLLGLGATGIASAIFLGEIDPPQTPPAHGGASRPPVPPAGRLSAPHLIDIAINGGLIAGGANLLNLFDLRPGRAIKVAAASGVLLAATDAGDSARRRAFPGGRPPQTPPIEDRGSPFRKTIVVAPPLGAALALLPDDLGERAMLGDGGANALGAMLGAAAAATLPRPARAGLLAGITALTLASEKISFTKVIERTPPLRWLDMLGRRPRHRARHSRRRA